MTKNNYSDIIKNLVDFDNYLILSHEHPDPDSIGSMLGLYHGLSYLGKNCVMISVDPIPNYLNWPGIDKIIHTMDDTSFDAIIVVDCEAERTGLYEFTKQLSVPVFNIDHHRGNKNLAHYSFIDTTQPATAIMIYYILQDLQVPISQEISQALYGGILGDTGGFRHSNTTSEILKVAAKLVEAGANPGKTAKEIFDTKSLEFLQFLGYALSKLKTSADQKITYMVLSYQDFNNYKVDPSETDQFVQYARMVASSKISILFREVSPNEVRIGFRGNNLDVHSLATKFGGGGHRLAAGAKLEGELSSIVSQIIEAAELLVFKGDL